MKIHWGCVIRQCSWPHEDSRIHEETWMTSRWVMTYNWHKGLAIAGVPQRDVSYCTTSPPVARCDDRTASDPFGWFYYRAASPDAPSASQITSRAAPFASKWGCLQIGKPRDGWLHFRFPVNPTKRGCQEKNAQISCHNKDL